MRCTAPLPALISRKCCVRDEKVLDVTFPADVLVECGMVEHASEAENERLCLHWRILSLPLVEFGGV
jgi:hypothetical protein